MIVKGQVDSWSGGDENLSQKNFYIIQYLMQNHQDEFDWFLKLDDDTYLCYKNLREFLQYYDPSKEWYIGSTQTFHVDSWYNSGGAGWVLSHKVLRKIIDLPNFQSLLETNNA